jgi:TIGR03009 family protein
LRRWEAVSQQNQTLYASFKRVDETKFGTTTFVGTALFRKPNLACLDWNEVVSSDKGEQSQVFTERIVCGNDRVYQMIGPTKQVIVYPLPQDARRRQLEEGPVPFLFNMQMQQAKARYHWRLLLEEPGKEGGAGKLYIEIVPLQKIDMEEFSKAWIILNDQSLLPEALQLFAPNGGKDKRTYTFGGVQRNGTGNLASNPVNFDGAAMAEVFRSKYGYKVIVNQANADPGAQLGARPAPAASPAPERSRRR